MTAPLPPSQLTNRQREVLTLVAAGKCDKEISADLNISVKTINKHRGEINQKVGTTSVALLTHYAIANGLVELKGVKP